MVPSHPSCLASFLELTHQAGNMAVLDGVARLWISQWALGDTGPKEFPLFFISPASVWDLWSCGNCRPFQWKITRAFVFCLFPPPKYGGAPGFKYCMHCGDCTCYTKNLSPHPFAPSGKTEAWNWGKPDRPTIPAVLPDPSGFWRSQLSVCRSCLVVLGSSFSKSACDLQGLLLTAW